MKRWEKFSKTQINQFVKESFSYKTLALKCGYNPNGGSSIQQIKNMIDELQLDVSHFTGQGWNKGKALPSSRKLSFEEYIKTSKNIQTNKIRKKLLSEGLKQHVCECCGNIVWCGKPIPLEVHHKDGDKTNNKLDNLELLCPNCHAQTDTYRGKNTKKYKQNN